MSEGILALKNQLLEAQAAAEYYHACYQCFWTGNLPNNATVDQLVMATHGRKRLDALHKTPVLLQGASNV